MKTPVEAMNSLKTSIRREWKIAFFSTFFTGLLIHLPVMVGDYPNHDGLSSMYFDQNMITSGRWFLQPACGISSYFTLPWLIGIFSLCFLGIGAAALTDFLEIKQELGIFLLCGLLVSFPALTSTYAYIFTADGYMLGLCLAFFSVAFTKKMQLGFLPGGFCLAFSMGIYQAYLPFAILLSIYGCLMLLLDNMAAVKKIRNMLHYLYMGLIGTASYYMILQILLKIQGKELDTYQGINGMASGGGLSLREKIQNIYGDFLAFTGKGNVLYNNTLTMAALLILSAVSVILLIRLAVKREYVKKWYFYVILFSVAALLPAATNVVLLISPEVTYHLLMRYQWCLYPILMLTFIVRYGFLQTELSGRMPAYFRMSSEKAKKIRTLGVTLMQWIVLASAVVLIFGYAAADNIAYSNLQKKYEKTYAYCLRMADRMEQTEGYYTGIPVAMIGVQSKENLPETDITGKVTGNMIGMTGDYLIYTSRNYQAFMKHYLGITINPVSDEEMKEIYYTEEYQSLNSFPENGSMKVVDGILYIKTE